jgi:DNA-binding MarR family transcriptional regulator
MAALERDGAEQVDAEVDTMGPALDFLRLLWSVDHALQTSSKRVERSQGATGPQQLVLRIMSLKPGITAGQIADILHLHPSTLTGILQRLDQRGMIARKDDPTDARKSLLNLSAKGRKLVTGKGNATEAAIKKVLAKMPGKVDAARELLASLTTELEAISQ